jgi:hypothetical protein
MSAGGGLKPMLIGAGFSGAACRALSKREHRRVTVVGPADSLP